MTINTKKITAFLRTLNEAEILYLQHCLDFAEKVRHMIRKHNLSKEQLCKLLHIKESQYNDYVKGARNFDLNDFANLNLAFVKLESEKLKDNVPVKIPKE